jgi:GntR family carbon starvation induced transcriptional regulator
MCQLFIGFNSVPTKLPSVSTFKAPGVVFEGDPTKNPTQAAVFWLRRDIVRGVFLPGERLKVDGLAQFYALGMSPIREAILILSDSGLVEHEHQRGYRVAMVSVEDYQDTLEIYNRIRRLALEMAMERADDDWEEQVVIKLHRSMKVPVVGPDADPEAREQWQRAYVSLQAALVSGCRSPLLDRLYRDVGARIERYGNLFADYTTDLTRDHRSEQWQIIDAMTSRSPAKLQSLLDAFGAAAQPVRDSAFINLQAWLNDQSKEPRNTEGV